MLLSVVGVRPFNNFVSRERDDRKNKRQAPPLIDFSPCPIMYGTVLWVMLSLRVVPFRFLAVFNLSRDITEYRPFV